MTDGPKAVAASSSFVLKLSIPRQVGVGKKTLAREDFYSWLWERFGGQSGLEGVHEGTLLSEQAASQGLETESWTLDAGEAPRERDWMAGQAWAEAELYFNSEKAARAAESELANTSPTVKSLGLREQKPEDWDAQWKASFLGNSNGVRVPPGWRILPPWVTAEAAELAPGELILRINPGAGFGTGTHETTQLCLEAIGGVGGLAQGLRGVSVLDFGSGSGILSIGAALLGGQVKGVEIDPLAIDNALENARLNGVENRVEYARTLDAAPGTYPLVIANILRPVLLEFAPELVKRLASANATLVLSGLIEKDVAEVDACYSALLGGLRPALKKLGDWRCLVWRRN
jgi:ribosomal protein L11 methyltransferase